MTTIDSQVHTYERNHPGRPWAGFLHGPEQVTGDDMVAAMDAVGVDGALLVSPYAMYRFDGSYALEVYKKHPSRFGLIKPFNPRELVARIQAVLRRHGERPTLGAPTTEGRVTFGAHTLDLAARTLERDGEVHTLTTGEFSLIKVFAQHPRQPLAREKLMLLARGRDHEVFDRAIDVQVSRLRKLLGEDPQGPRFIQTVWGFGYVFVPDGAPAR